MSYSCPDAASTAACESGGNVTKCTPIGKTRGTVATGGTCTLASASELQSNCAPNPAHAVTGDETGSFCAYVGIGDNVSFCSHPCSGDGDCNDVTVQGKATSCSGFLTSTVRMCAVPN